MRAVYDHGALRLPEEVQLTERQEVYVQILSEKERVRAAFGDLVAEAPELEDSEIDEAALLEEIAKGFKGTPLLSEAIIAERHCGP